MSLLDEIQADDERSNRCINNNIRTARAVLSATNRDLFQLRKVGTYSVTFLAKPSITLPEEDISDIEETAFLTTVVLWLVLVHNHFAHAAFWWCLARSFA